MEVRVLMLEDFADHVGSNFALRVDPERLFVLEEAAPLQLRDVPPDMRPPFRLMFRHADPQIFPQQLYDLDHPEIGPVSIFLVPESRNETGVRYCATFC